MNKTFFRIPVGALALCFAVPVFGHDDHTPVLEEIVVYGRAEQLIGVAQSASEGMVGYDDIQLAPLLRVGELAEAVPGMVATQHSGTGKANQYYLRGFNLDHGTDFAANAEGVPLNMRTHGHGQGYLDLNFMIPELVATTRYRKGPYSAQTGDFSSAGSVDFSFYDRLDESIAELSAGEYGYYRSLLATSANLGDGALTGAIDVTRYDGPWALDEDLQQEKLYVSYQAPFAFAQAKFTLQGYWSDWDATDQIPLRAVRTGLIDDLGFIDPDLGGQTDRLALTSAFDFGSWQLSAYMIDYDFTLFSNFTYLLDDPVLGDEFEQHDDRRIYGARVDGSSLHTIADRAMYLRWGGDARLDDIREVGLYRTASRQRIDTVRSDTVDERSLGAFVEAEWALTEQLRAALGIRADYYDWDVDARRADNGGSGDDQLLSPKFRLAYRVTDGLETYLNYGRGMHSNDVRGTTIRSDPMTGDPVDPVEALVASEGAEVGVRFESAQRFNATLIAFWLTLDSELVFVGDAGGTEANDGSQRRGIEATAFWQANDWLAVNATYTHTDAEFRNAPASANHIPGAIESNFTMGLNAAWRNGLSASVRLRHLGEAPLTEDNSVRAETSTSLHVGAAYRRGRTEWRLDVFNALDSDDNDISYYYASRLSGEAGAGVEDIHFHPLEPRSVRATVTWLW
ncbi:MAG: TonB-dependent receptor [Pseudomonadota bacterium]